MDGLKASCYPAASLLKATRYKRHHLTCPKINDQRSKTLFLSGAGSSSVLGAPPSAVAHLAEHFPCRRVGSSTPCPRAASAALQHRRMAQGMESLGVASALLAAGPHAAQILQIHAASLCLIAKRAAASLHQHRTARAAATPQPRCRCPRMGRSRVSRAVPGAGSPVPAPGRGQQGLRSPPLAATTAAQRAWVVGGRRTSC